MTDMILVHTTPDAKQSYGMSAHLINLTGKFDVGDHFESFGDVKGVLYRLEAYKPPVE